MEADKKRIIARLRRIEGQIRGLQKLIENGAPCVAGITQVSAATAAMKKTAAAVIMAHMDTCMKEPGEDTDLARREFQTALGRFIDLS
jgi:DNA-binding FrmR family transcriptional regulator